MNLLLDENGDLAVENNQLSLVEGADEITQLISQRLKTFFGEWFLDNTIGIPWFQRILEKGVNPAMVEAIITKEILDTDGVLELTELVLDYSATERNLSMTPTVRVENDPALITFKTDIGV